MGLSLNRKDASLLRLKPHDTSAACITAYQHPKNGNCIPIPKGLGGSQILPLNLCFQPDLTGWLDP
ncbi:MAG: hypothetical protein EBU00_01400 [Alphaproteobacteria bacterium]|nr:hypothetical protein [Alphaproteobacteria bacterium]